jgi:hypothetical protein
MRSHIFSTPRTTILFQFFAHHDTTQWLVQSSRLPPCHIDTYSSCTRFLLPGRQRRLQGLRRRSTRTGVFSIEAQPLPLLPYGSLPVQLHFLYHRCVYTFSRTTGFYWWTHVKRHLQPCAIDSSCRRSHIFCDAATDDSSPAVRSPSRGTTRLRGNRDSHSPQQHLQLLHTFYNSCNVLRTYLRRMHSDSRKTDLLFPYVDKGTDKIDRSKLIDEVLTPFLHQDLTFRLWLTLRVN